jgi:NTE family protein
VATERAVVLGGGGVAGIAWETGVLIGLADEGVNVTTADFVVGTSAGATVAAQLGSGLPLDQLFKRQADPALQTPELAPTGMSVTELTDTMVNLVAENEDPAELRRRVGALALTANTVPESARLAVIEARLPMHAWPDRALCLVAVDAHTGEPRIFDRAPVSA